jgi:site-specific DNA-methyltransferase (adenine-specific)
MNYQLYHGDCFEYMRSMPDKSVDIIITDPPYGERTHKGATSSRVIHDVVDKLIDFKHMSLERLFEFCKESIRVSRRWVVFTCELNYAAKIEDNPELKDYLVRVGAWIKPNAAPQFTGDRPGQGWEAVVVLHDTYKKQWNDGGHHAVWIYNIVQGKHPTKKPPALIKKWLDQFTDPGETIFDPFMGEGTTGVCCMEMGRNFIGCEIEKKWFDLAEKQIAAAANQESLFDQAALF